jgi:hypothetical protein
MRPLRLIALFLESLLVRYQLWSQQRYTDDAERTGIHTSLDMNAFKAERDALRIRLIDIHGRMSPARAKGARLQASEPDSAAANDVDGRRHYYGA